jgi:Flp pilus assembly protein TadG
MAIVAVIFFVFLFGVMEWARYIFTQNLLNNAAREGARFAIVHSTTATTAQVQTYVDGYLAGQGASGLVSYNKTMNITVYQADPTTGSNNSGGWQNVTQGQAIGVTISGTYNAILPNFLFTGSALQIQGTAVMYSETM